MEIVTRFINFSDTIARLYFTPLVGNMNLVKGPLANLIKALLWLIKTPEIYYT